MCVWKGVCVGGDGGLGDVWSWREEQRHFKLVKKTSTRGGRIAVAQATMFLVQVVK